MAQNLQYDIDSIGGYGNGFGGFGANPLLWLITLGFLKGDGLLGGGNNTQAAGVLAGETQAKLDCLAQGQNNLADQISGNLEAQRFATLNAQIDNLAGISRDQTAAITGQINDLSRQNSECCCELRAGQQEIKTAIALQTNELLVNANNNTQKILDKFCEQEKTALTTENNRLRDELNKAEIIAAMGHK